MYAHECYESRTNVSYPSHEFVGGKCTRCGEADTQMEDDEQERLAALYADTLDAGGYEQQGAPVPHASTAYAADGSPVVRRLPHGYEEA